MNANGPICETLKKHTKPTQFDVAEMGTIWEEVTDTGEDNNFYIQASNSCLSSNWIPLSSFFVKAFEEFLFNKEFMQETFGLYKRNTASKDSGKLEMIITATQNNKPISE